MDVFDLDRSGEHPTAPSTLSPRVTVGVAAGPELPARPPDLDVLLTSVVDPPAPWVCATPDVLARAVSHAPNASVALVQVLRHHAGAPVPDGLLVESLAYSVLQAGPEFARWLASTPRPAPKVTAEPPVIVERDGSTLTITLNRPEARNAYNVAVRDALVEALQLVAADSTIATAELRGNGPAFCAGGDLSEFGTAPNPVTAHVVRTARSAAAWMHACGTRVVAHVHGACVGAGIELPAFAARVAAADDATFTLPEVAMGLIPGAGGTVSITRRIGRQRAGYLALSGATIDARTARAWGLIDEIRPRRPSP